MKNSLIRRRVTAIAIGTCVVLAVAGCGSSADSSSEDAVHVGLLINRTGDAAVTYGLPFQEGFDLAQKDAHDALKSAGVELKVSVEDAKSTVPAAVTGYNSLRDDGASIVINDSQSPLGQAVAPLANDNKTAFLTGAGSDLENPDGYAFKFTDLKTPTENFGEYLANLGAERVGAVVSDATPSLATLADITEDGLPNGFVTRESISADDTDFSAVLANLRKADIDTVVLSTLPAQAGNLLLQATKSDSFSDDTIIAGTVASSSEIFEVAGDAADGMVFPQVWAPGGSDSKDFETAYKDAADEAPTSYGALGYQVGWIVAQAAIQASESGTVDGTSFKNALPSASTSELVQDHGILDMTLKKGGDVVSKGVVATFADDGTIVVAETD